MPSFGVAVAWIIISSAAFITDFVSLLVILHYRSRYHSCDVAFISILVTMITNSWLLLPVPAVMKLGDIHWSKRLCTFYTWLSIVLRSSHLLVLLVLNVYWMASLRMSPKGRMFMSSMSMKASVCAVWFVSVMVGLLPVAGDTEIFHFYEEDVCKFLPTNISIGFAIFFIITSLLSAVMGSVSTLDTLFVLRSMKDVTLMRYSAGRYRVATISGAGNPCSQIQYNELKFSAELCRLVLCFSTFSAALNGLPLLVSQFIQLIQGHDRETLEVTLLWLLLIESLTLPHLLWLLSSRYRHAFVYTWKVFVIRDKNAKEDDMAACTLQSYRLKVKETRHLPNLNGVMSHQTNGTLHGTLNQGPSSDVTRSGSRINEIGQGQTTSNPVTSDLDDGMTVFSSLARPELLNLHENRGQHKMYTQTTGQNGTRNKLDTFSYRPTDVPPKIPTTTLSTMEVNHSLEHPGRSKTHLVISSVKAEDFKTSPFTTTSQDRMELMPISPNKVPTEDKRISINLITYPANDISLICNRLDNFVRRETNMLTNKNCIGHSSLPVRSLDYPTDNLCPTVTISGNLTNRSSELTPVRNVHKSARIIGVYYDDTDTIKSTDIMIDPTSTTKRGRLRKRENSHRKVMSQTNLIISVVDEEPDKHCQTVEETNEITEEHSNFSAESNKQFHLIGGQSWLLQNSLPEHTSTPTQPSASADGTYYTQGKDTVNRISQRATLFGKDKLDAISGPELINLKLRSVRAAMAIYSSDDTTSERWELDTTTGEDAV